MPQADYPPPPAVHNTTWNTARLNADAVNRAVRSFIGALFVELVATAGPVMWQLLNDEETQWDGDLVQSLARIIGLAAFSYVLRRFGDPSGIPTPLPPVNPGAPADTDAP